MAAKTPFEKSMNQRLHEINEQLDSVYSSMQESMLEACSDDKEKEKTLKQYDMFLREYKDLISCQMMIAKNYNDIVGVGNKTENKAKRKKTTLEMLRDKEG